MCALLMSHDKQGPLKSLLRSHEVPEVGTTSPTAIAARQRIVNPTRTRVGEGRSKQLLRLVVPTGGGGVDRGDVELVGDHEAAKHGERAGASESNQPYVYELARHQPVVAIVELGAKFLRAARRVE